MGSEDDDRTTYNGDFSEEGVVKLKERVKVKLKEYMGDYTDDILVEYVIVLLKNGRRKEEAKNELKIFLADDSDSFVAWLWDHLGESVDEYFTSSRVEKTNTRSSLVSSLNEDKEALVEMDRQWRTQASDVPPLLSSEVHKVHDYDKEDHRERRGKRSPSPQTRSHRKRSKTDSSRDEQKEAKPVVSSRLLQFAMRDALGTSKPTEPSLKRLRSVVSASTQDPSEPEPARKTRANPKSGRSVFDRISQPTGVSETSDQHMILGEVPPKNEERRNFSEDQEPVQHQYSQRLDNNGVYVENMTTFDTGLQSNLPSDRSRLGSSVNGSHSIKGTDYQNHLTEVATKQKNGGFSGNADTGKTVKLEEQMKVPDVGLQRYTDGGRLVSSDSVRSGNTKPAAIAKEDSVTKKPVPGTLSTTRPLEDARSRTIFVANVHFAATKDSLSRHFNKFGEVLKAVIVTDPATGQPSGSAYIEFTRKESADSALSLDGTSFMSRILKIVKGSNEQQQEAASSMSWSRAGRYARATPYRRGIPGGAFRGRSVVRAGARSMQWKRDSAETGNNNAAAPSTRNMTYLTIIKPHQSNPHNVFFFFASLTLFFFFASTLLYAHAFNITRILNLNNEFSTFNNLLSQTGLASTINSRQTITVLALSNDAVSVFTDQSTEDNKKSLSLHVVLDYYDIKKLKSLNKKSVILTTLFQSSGQAKGQQGFINATVMSNGDVMFGSAVPGSILDAKLIDSVATHPYDISVLHISSYIPIMNPEGPSDHGSSSSPLPPQPPGDDDYTYDEPPSPPSSTTKPVVAAATAATAKPPSAAKANSTTSGVPAINTPHLAFAFVISSFWFFVTVW
ncbi:hypothetical protein Bca52824_021047 [Brassica carinata]|uniref:RRM domain-containing protein n=1 Tax=Brassica carinata TaxID=52824 RepID=A0A8X7VW67_BRACI|nr:hypothetical protein Bca52824_021047 [Brassica carinata]